MSILILKRSEPESFHRLHPGIFADTTTVQEECRCLPTLAWSTSQSKESEKSRTPRNACDSSTKPRRRLARVTLNIRPRGKSRVPGVRGHGAPGCRLPCLCARSLRLEPAG